MEREFKSRKKALAVTSIDELARHVAALPVTGDRRLIVAIAGAPAGGKSQMAATLNTAVNLAGRAANQIPMDGFHIDNTILDARGTRHRKGAPETFDVGGFISLVHRIRTREEVVYPLFDRSRDLAVAGAAVIESECDVAIIEGNYLLLDEDSWRSLAPLWDISVWIEIPEQLVIERCVQRWLDHGHTLEAARARALGNDLANARRVNDARLPADVTLRARR